MIKRYGGAVALISLAITIVIALVSGLITKSIYEPATIVVAVAIGIALLFMDFKYYEKMATSDADGRKKLYYRDMTIRALSELALLIALGVVGAFCFNDHVLVCLLLMFVGFFIPRLSYHFARKWVQKKTRN